MAQTSDIDTAACARLADTATPRPLVAVRAKLEVADERSTRAIPEL